MLLKGTTFHLDSNVLVICWTAWGTQVKIYFDDAKIEC